MINLFNAFADAETPDPNLITFVPANTNPGLFTSTAINSPAGTLTLDYAANAHGTADLTVRAPPIRAACLWKTLSVLP
ncbi:MAG: hypothetical protein R3C28_26390 [Pirellulaceae bacterium]